mmetsp:Transcript_58700/g.139882  ORF Transcript_58700/g.139882 Transcript_58700/m.139882 type:complete len:269 (-) Transcript_58700:941-1747(-)
MVTMTNQNECRMLGKGDSSFSLRFLEPSGRKYAPLSSMPSCMSFGCPSGYHSPCSKNHMRVPKRQQPIPMKNTMSDNAGTDCETTRVKRVKASLYLPNLKTRKTRDKRSSRKTSNAPPPPTPELVSRSSQKGRMAQRSMRLAGRVVCLMTVISLPSTLRSSTSSVDRNDDVAPPRIEDLVLLKFLGKCAPSVPMALEPIFKTQLFMPRPSSHNSPSIRSSSSKPKRTLCTVSKRSKYSNEKTYTQKVSMLLKTGRGSGSHWPFSMLLQ